MAGRTWEVRTGGASPAASTACSRSTGIRTPPAAGDGIDLGGLETLGAAGRVPAAAAPWATNPSTTLAETTPARATAAPVELSRAKRERLLFEVAHVLIAPDGEEAAP